MHRKCITVSGLIKKRVSQSMTGMHSGIAIALVIGDRSGIDEESQEILRQTGLAHILAISGLHMALVAISAISVMRIAVSFNPWLSLTLPTKKWAVAIGFGAATIYLFLSGGGVATQRAWVMLSVMLFAVLADRRALTLRNVSVAALFLDK